MVILTCKLAGLMALLSRRLSPYLPSGLTIVLLALSAPALAAPSQFYVSPDGDDANPGTIGQPFETIDRARLAVRGRLVAGITEDIWVYLRGGVYRIETPITFDALDSAPPGLFVHYAAYEDERPVISGGRLIDGWTDHGDGSWSTTVPGVTTGDWTFRELFVNGKRRQRARHPNSGFLQVAGPNPAVGENTRSTFSFAPGDLPTGTDLAGAEINMLHEWSTSRVPVANVDQVARTLTTAQPLGATPTVHSIFQTSDHPRYAVENHAALLDAPGEWFLDKTNGELTYHAMPGEFASTAEVVAPIAKELLVARGDFSDGTPVRNLRFVNLSFEHSAWALPPDGYATWQSGYYEPRGLSPYELPAAVKFEVAEGCELLRTRVAHCGGWGVMLGAWCRNCSLVGSIVTDIAGNGVLVGEDRYRQANDNAQWVINHWEQVAYNNLVSSNVIQDCGVVFQGCVGLWIGLTDNSKIRNNLIRRIPYIGISAGGFWDERESPARELLIMDNRIHDIVQLMSDGGALYTVGLQPLSAIRGNLISGVPSAPGLAQNTGVFVDEGSTGFTILDNGIFDVDDALFKFHYAGANSLISNTMRLSSPGAEPYYFQPADEDNITRTGNVIIDPSSPPPGCEYPVCGEADSAGLLAEHTAWIYFDRDGDGVADFEDACVERRPGDVSGDGDINGLDIAEMVRVLTGDVSDSDNYCAADTDGNGTVNPADADVFLQSLLQP
ncbi:MAG TPA: right-handed parallel beta-helix repeat-containing protein [Phycisphaerae bacterium]|nr:right-handed parallel beta-helix repeat-containing protein [Phycisphaerae bacterium]